MATRSSEDVDETTQDRVQVFLRLRPVQGQGKEEDGVLEVVDTKSVSIFSADQDEPTTFELDGVLDESASNSQVIESVCGNLAERFVSGRDCTVMAYGPLQTGKTFNLFGNICQVPKNEKKNGTEAKSGGTKETAAKSKPPEKPLHDDDDDDNDDKSDDSDLDDSDGSDVFLKSKKNKSVGAEGMDFDDFGALDDLIQGALEGIPAEDDDTDQSEGPSEGAAVALCRQIFDALEKDSLEILGVTIKLSVVEIYLDRITDLLLPQSEGDDVYLKENPRGGSTLIQGCSALSCVRPLDMVDTIRRALQQRTRSQFHKFRDSHRSTVVVQMRLEQERKRQDCRSSVLQIVDLCASEFASDGSLDAAQQLDQSIAAGIQSLQKEVTEPTPFSALGERPTLSRLLLPFCRGETVARVLVTASKMDVGACQRSLDFGLACRQLPAVRLPDPETILPDSTPTDDAIERERRLTELVFALAHECNRVSKSAKTPRHGPIWTAISEIQKLPQQHRPLRFSVATKRDHEINAEKFAIRAELREAERKANTHKHLMKQLESDVQVLRAQNEQLHQDLKHRSDQLDQTKHRILELEQRIKEVEHNLRTSQFRESEAVVFLRQFRKFYYRLMRQIHGEDASPGGSLVKRIAGAPDLIQLIDLDQSMVESGLMEEEEVGKDVPLSKTYLPSRQALVRSVVAADTAAKAVESDTGEYNGPPLENGDDAIVLSGEAKAQSIVKRHETGEATEARQRIFKTPAGRYLAMRESALERELLTLSEKFSNLQSELEEEKETRKTLESSSPAVNKAKHAKELRTLKEKLAKKSNDLKAVIFKMNEIHAVSKALQEKLVDREQHVEYLEEELSSMQAKESALLEHKEEVEKGLKQEIEDIQLKLEATPTPIWQLSEPGTTPPPITSRISLSFALRANIPENDDSERISIGEDDDWLDRLYQNGMTGGGGGEAVGSEEFEALKGELERLKVQLREAKSRPAVSGRKKFGGSVGARLSMPNQYSGTVSGVSRTPEPVGTGPVHADDLEIGTDGSGENEHSLEAKDLSESNNSVSGLLFMDDDVATSETPQAKTSRRPSVYGGLVDAYKMQSQSELMPNEDLTEVQPGSFNKSSSYMPTSIASPQKSTSSFVSSSIASPQKSTSSYTPPLAASPQKSEEPVTHKRTHSATNHVARWQPPKPKPSSADDGSGVPEWLRKFQTIAAKNHAESVIETSGSAEARELTRTSFGETLKLAHGNENKDDGESEPFKKWTPKKKSVDGSDSDSDDSFAKNFLAGASTHVTEPIPSYQAEVESSEGSDVAGSEPEDEVEGEKATDPDHDSSPRFDEPSANENSFDQPSTMHQTAKLDETATSFLNGSNNGDKPATKQVGDTRAGSPKVVEAQRTPPKKKSFLEDSESGDDSSDDEPTTKTAPVSIIEPSKPNPALVPPKKPSFLDDSESDSDEQPSTKTASVSEPEPPKPIPASAPAPGKKKSFLDDSDSDDGSSGDESKTKAPPASKEEPPQPNQAPASAPTKKSFLDDSDSEDDSTDEERKAKASPEPPKNPLLAPAPVPPQRTKSFLDSDSDDSSASQVETAPVSKPESPKSVPSPAPAPPPPKKSSFLDDSESSVSDDESKAEPTPTRRSDPPKPAPVPPKKKSSFLDDSDSDDDSDEESRAEPANHASAPKKSFLDDSEMESDEDEPLKEVPSFAAPTLPPKVQSKAVRDDSGSDSELDQSSRREAEEFGGRDSEDETERAGAGSGHRRKTGNDMDISERSSPIGDPPVVPGRMIGSEHDSESEHSSRVGGKPANAMAVRGVPDFGAEVRSGIPQAPDEPGGKFVIKNGKLVKDSGHSKATSKKKKPKFTIVGGKLVQDDSSAATTPSDAGGTKSPGKHAASKGSGDESATASPRRASVTAMVPAARSKQKGGGKGGFSIKGGKLVKGEEKPQQPAFSIVGGKLLKGDAKKGKKGKKVKK